MRVPPNTDEILAAVLPKPALSRVSQLWRADGAAAVGLALVLAVAVAGVAGALALGAGTDSAGGFFLKKLNMVCVLRMQHSMKHLTTILVAFELIFAVKRLRFAVRACAALVATGLVGAPVWAAPDPSQQFTLRNGMTLMRNDGERLVREGISTREELIRVTRD
jgi:hypothetical protein